MTAFRDQSWCTVELVVLSRSCPSGLKARPWRNPDFLPPSNPLY